MEPPSFQIESQFIKKGYTTVAGVDEVGRGCLAGPVVAAAVILDPLRIPPGINDSKKLSPSKRELVESLIRAQALAWAVGVGEVEEIDRINILNAAKLAMVRALGELSQSPDFVLVDGNFKIPYDCPQLPVVKGDQKSVSIAAASVLAKVYRDRMMVTFDEKYPGYDFASHKGYGSRAHRQQLQKKGPCEIHRKTFSWTPV